MAGIKSLVGRQPLLRRNNRLVGRKPASRRKSILMVVGMLTQLMLVILFLSNSLRALLDLTQGSVPEQKARALSDAINTLRCLTIPGCYPTAVCSDNKEPMRVPTSHIAEQQDFCSDDLTAQGREPEQNCLVYSFGINDSTEWEEMMNRVFGCDVFAFDPTSNFPTDIAPGVTFHQLGLQGAGLDLSKSHSALYDALDPTKLRSLGEIVKLLGHGGRKVDILRLDCEGCEWGVLKQLACSSENLLVKQLMVEMHFQKNLGLGADDDILIAADAITCLEQEHWGIASMEQAVCSLEDAQYIDSALKIIRGPKYLQLTTMKRFPEEHGLSWNKNSLKGSLRHAMNNIAARIAVAVLGVLRGCGQLLFATKDDEDGQ